ncbi:MAG: sugar ABC transporter permease, partial [Brachybacterium sp.]|nr:sugar ABC transporter permease [Brachybacterium sp.]
MSTATPATSTTGTGEARRQKRPAADPPPAARPTTRMRIPARPFFGLFALVPLAGVVALSFVHWDGLGTPSWAGLANWQQVLSSGTTRNAIVLTLLLTVLTFLVQFPLSVLLGTFMAGQQKYRELFSVLYFLPLLFSAAA